jgi:hypothetical protein
MKSQLWIFEIITIKINMYDTNYRIYRKIRFLSNNLFHP